MVRKIAWLLTRVFLIDKIEKISIVLESVNPYEKFLETRNTSTQEMFYGKIKGSLTIFKC